MANLAFDLYDGPKGPPPPDTTISSSVQQSLREKGHLAPILIRNSDGKRFDIENILIEWCKRNGTIFPPDLPTDGSKVQQNLHQPLDRNSLHIETTNGNFDIRIIHMSLLFCRSQKLVPVSKLTEYSNPSSALVQTAEWVLQEKTRLSMHRDLTSGETKVRMSAE